MNQPAMPVNSPTLAVKIAFSHAMSILTRKAAMPVTPTTMAATMLAANAAQMSSSHQSFARNRDANVF